LTAVAHDPARQCLNVLVEAGDLPTERVEPVEQLAAQQA